MHSLAKDFLKLQANYFGILGFDIFAEDSRSWRHPWKTLWSFLALASVQPMIIAFGIMNLENVDKMTNALGSLLINVLALLKFALMIWMRKDFVKLVKRFQSMLLRGKQLQANIDFSSVYLQSANRRCLRRS